MDNIQKLADYIDHSNSIVAMTGAGISVAGGGVTYGQMLFSGRGGLRRSGDGNSSFLPIYLENMFSYQPSFAHYALADLEAEGKLIGIITTNVDCMHTIAGSKNVAEIQGSLQVNCCSNCGCHYDGYEIWKQELDAEYKEYADYEETLDAIIEELMASGVSMTWHLN